MAYTTVDMLAGLGTFTADAPLATKSLDDRHGLSLARIAIDSSRLAARWQAAGTSPAVQPKAVSSDSVACSSGGNITMTVDDADNDGSPSSADTIELRFNACREDGALLNGAIRLTSLSSVATADGRSGSDAATVTIDNLSASSDGVTETANGRFSFQLAWQDYPQTYELTLSGQSIVISGPAGRSELAGFTYREHGDAMQYGLTVDGTLKTRLGEHRLSTPAELSSRYGEYPSAGTLQIAAPDHSSLAMTAVSNTTVRLDLDADGDGRFEKSEQLSWDDLADGTPG